MWSVFEIKSSVCNFDWSKSDAKNMRGHPAGCHGGKSQSILDEFWQEEVFLVRHTDTQPLSEWEFSRWKKGNPILLVVQNLGESRHVEAPQEQTPVPSRARRRYIVLQ